MKQLIVTADDFGISLAVNQAVEEAHRHGILSAASLMVAGEAAADAVARARRMPNLGVGLHLVLVDGTPLLPAGQVSRLVDASGRFSSAMAAAGIRLYVDAVACRQAEAEVRAQLEAFHDTGLRLDHVNAHHHFHFHPMVREILIRLAPEFGIRAIRLPREPALLTWRACGDRLMPRAMNKLVLGWFAAQMRRRLDRAGITHNDWQFGLSDTGAMTAARSRKFATHLPDGVTEIYSHPSAERGDPGFAEFQALLDFDLAALLAQQGVRPLSFAAL